jgi:hypothetical protein
MWAFLKRFLARSGSLDALLGDVIFETLLVRGVNSDCWLQWRVKRGAGNAYFIGLKMSPDASTQVMGSSTDYMNFDIEGAKQLRNDLDRCIAEYYRMTSRIPPDAAQSDRVGPDDPGAAIEGTPDAPAGH